MSRCYKRKTDRHSTSVAEMERAVQEVQKGKYIRQVAIEMKINRINIAGYMNKKKKG